MLRKASGLFLCAAILLTQPTSPLASNLCGQADDMLCSLRGALGGHCRKYFLQAPDSAISGLRNNPFSRFNHYSLTIIKSPI